MDKAEKKLQIIEIIHFAFPVHHLPSICSSNTSLPWSSRHLSICSLMFYALALKHCSTRVQTVWRLMTYSALGGRKWESSKAKGESGAVHETHHFFSPDRTEKRGASVRDWDLMAVELCGACEPIRAKETNLVVWKAATWLQNPIR